MDAAVGVAADAGAVRAPAGRQGQVDYATFTLPWGRRYALLMVLGHSRVLWVPEELSFDQTSFMIYAFSE